MATPTPNDWNLPMSCVFMAYGEFCDMRGEEPNPEFLGRMVRIKDGEARLVGDEDDGTQEIPTHHCP